MSNQEQHLLDCEARDWIDKSGEHKFPGMFLTGLYDRILKQRGRVATAKLFDRIRSLQERGYKPRVRIKDIHGHCARCTKCQCLESGYQTKCSCPGDTFGEFTCKGVAA